jgi:hypothetical protein
MFLLLRRWKFWVRGSILNCIIADDIRLFGARASQEDWSAVTRDSILQLLGHYELEIFEQGDKLILLKRPI